MKTIQLIHLLLTGGLALGLVNPSSMHYYHYQSGKLDHGPWQGGIVQTPQYLADINRDGKMDELKLTDGNVEIQSGGEILYRSDADWRVVQAEFADLNRDGQPEAVLLVWRAFEPWPIDRLLPAGGRISGFHDTRGQSCHIILIGWGGSGPREAWAGSALADPVQGFAIADLDGDAGQELVTAEGDYHDSSYLFAKAVKIWEWNGFGFTRREQIDLPARQVLIGRDGDGGCGIIISTH